MGRSLYFPINLPRQEFYSARFYSSWTPQEIIKGELILLSTIVLFLTEKSYCCIVADVDVKNFQINYEATATPETPSTTEKFKYPVKVHLHWYH